MKYPGKNQQSGAKSQIRDLVSKISQIISRSNIQGIIYNQLKTINESLEYIYYDS